MQARALESSEVARTAFLTGLALAAFAANSVLCRLALGRAAIDAASFTVIRLVAGAVTLFVVAVLVPGEHRSEEPGDWPSAVALFLYAGAFSFAYVSLSAGTGALILFAAVQTTMIFAALRNGERPSRTEWMGLLLALTGLVYLVSPGISSPSPQGSALMVLAGVSWGVYTLRGRGRFSPLAATRGNFIRSVPLALGVGLFLLQRTHVSWEGALLAGMSGSLASALGYAVWYGALRGLTTTRAAAVQLSVPVLAALAGVIYLAEPFSLRLLLSAFAILGGLGLVLVGRTRGTEGQPSSRHAAALPRREPVRIG